ncbi:NAD(P)(+) transhydrogenase (Re/Si-specific) subunit alpha, partial [Xanthomonas oryzae pv. oryzae]
MASTFCAGRRGRHQRRACRALLASPRLGARPEQRMAVQVLVLKERADG